MIQATSQLSKLSLLGPWPAIPDCMWTSTKLPAFLLEFDRNPSRLMSMWQAQLVRMPQ